MTKAYVFLKNFMFLVFDVGGTKIRIATSPDGKKFVRPLIVPTPKRFSEGISLFRQFVANLRTKKIKAAAGGVPGSLNSQKSKILTAPHLPGWQKKPFKQELQKIFRAPVFLENDTSLVGLGEAVAGAGRGYKIVAYVTVSTGVNGVRVIEGKLDRSAFGFEIGHQVIAASRAKTHNLEHYISGAALIRRFGRLPSKITDPKVKENLAKWLAYAVNNTVVYWSPDAVVLGGSLVRLNLVPFERVKFHLRKILKIFPHLPVIRKSALGDLGGLHGALVYLQQLRKS